jgi:hypothetical protein
MTVWVVNWEEEETINFNFDKVWRRKRRTFDDKFEANLFADYIISSKYIHRVRDVYIQAH